MIRTLILVLAVTSPALACSLCGDAFTRRQTLRQQYADAKYVLHGQLKNPKPNADGIGGTTEFHVVTTLKTDPAAAVPKIVLLKQYIPVIADTPTDYLVFCNAAEGKFDPYLAVSFNADAKAYLEAAAKLDVKDAPALLGFYFQHLESKDEAIARDAFTEFARAADTQIQSAASRYDRGKLRAWIADPKVPEERLGVYALMLGLSGTGDDAAWLAQQLASPRTERITVNLGGLLAGLTLLDSTRGWPMIQSLLADTDVNISEKLSVVGTLRYFQATRPTECRKEILAGCKALLAGDLADIAIDDLRRWGWWDLTADVLKMFETAKSPLMKRGIVRYALSCPDAKEFVAKVRANDAKLVEKVEASLK